MYPGKILNTLGVNIVKSFFSIAKVFIFNFDMTKDLILWAYLFSRIHVFDQNFIIGMIYFNAFAIFFAQSLMGFYIALRSKHMFEISEGCLKRLLLKFVLFLFTPIVPSLVILKLTRTTC